MIDRPHRSGRRLASCTRLAVVLVLAVAACGKFVPDSPAPTPDGPDVPVDAMPLPAVCNTANPAPTYTQLYTKYFAVGTPGHCAKSGCHGDDFTVWECGSDKATCYAGMAGGGGLINKNEPLKSLIADPKNSPLRWINEENGYMPADKSTDLFPEGRDAILAWVGACAQNN